MEGSEFKYDLVKHFINRKVIQELLQLQNIQTIQKTPQIMSDMVDKFKAREEKLIYAIMKKELKEDFSNFRYLASGNQGYVILAKENLTNVRFAIKGCFVRDEEGKVEEEADLKDAKQEIETLQQCRGSPYVSNLIKSIDLEKNQLIYLVFTEYLGTLQDIIDSTQDKKLNEISAIKYSKDIAEGLLHIHSKGYLVNDLKMDNILIDYNGNAVVGDFGYAQKLKNNQGYAYNEYQGNLYFQAPECVDRKTMNLYEEEYKKLGVETQMNPSQRSEACSFGYLIYTLVQGEKQAYTFINEKHKPLVYDDNFKSFKYSQQLQQIIDGLTRFIPKERWSIKDALEQLKEIVSIKMNLDQKFQILISEQSQQELSQNHHNEIEFIETYDKKYFPIVKNEDSFLKKLVSEKDFSNKLLEKSEQLQIENKCEQNDQENLKRTLKDRESQLQEIQVTSQINLKKKDQEIMDLKGKLQTKEQEVQYLKINLEYLQNLKLSLLQKQDNLQGFQKIDQNILQIEEENKLLKQNKVDLETQIKYYLVSQDQALQEIQELKEKIKEISEREQKKIQELEEKIKYLESDKNKVQFSQYNMMNQQQPKTNLSNQIFQGLYQLQAQMIQPLNNCQCEINQDCQKACAKCGHGFCGDYWYCIPINGKLRCRQQYRKEREGCCKCRAIGFGQTCSLGCKCDYCQEN